MIPRPRPRALDRQARKRDEERLYRQQREIALQRDGRRCRICGAGGYVETHHVTPRSHFGSKAVVDKHDAGNLLTVCGGASGCHDMLTGNVLKAYATTPAGAAGAVLVLRYDDAAGDYVTWREAV
jgi:5-methylcytosine-specific restriction endonuclease McrA